MKKLLTLLVLCLLPVALSANELPSILSDEDAEIYAQIFSLQSKEKIDAAIKLDKKLTDDLLMNEVLYQ
ncbi:MAG: hypothetical protein LBF37_02435, partial [Rickettsiales bacterium]|nr:hypothetical protein [Rickettsiales bacterium]